jgi:hypothetical protein
MQSFAAKNPAMTASIISSGLSHQAAANPNSKWSALASNPKVAGALGRVGASGLAVGAAQPANGAAGGSAKAAPPPPPAKRGDAAGLMSSKVSEGS